MSTGTVALYAPERGSRMRAFRIARGMILSVAILACACGGERGDREAAASAQEEPAAITLALGGMHCQGCADAIHAAIAAAPGVLADSVSFADSSAVVRFRPGETSPEQIIAAVERIGYRAAVRPESQETP
jgi:copper chaperone